MTMASFQKLSNLASLLGQGTKQDSSALSSDDQQKVIAWVNEQYSHIKFSRAVIERQWYYNMAFYFGRQYVVFKTAGNSVIGTGSGLYTPPAPPWRARPVINRIRPVVRKEMSKLLAQKPTAYIIPASSEDQDLFAAQAGEQIWESMYHEKKVRSILRKAAWWNSICGSSFLKCYWDETAVDSYNQALGDISIINVTPFHLMVPDFREEDLENQPYLIHAQLKHVEALQLDYPDAKFELGQKTANEIIDSTWLNLSGAGGAKDQGMVLVLEAWIKPKQFKLFPEGAVVTIAADNLVQFSPGWPYEHQCYPFAKIDHIPSGKFYGDSVITDLISIQKEFNRRRGQIQEAANRMAKPQWVAEKGSVDASKMTSEPGQVHLYKPGFNPPQQAPIVNLPPYIFNEIDLMKSDMNDISAQHEISRGQVPPNVEAATAISFLQEQDDTMLSHTYESLEEGIEKIAKLALSYVQQYWDYERMVKVTGVDGSFDVIAFKGSYLNGNTDIRVEAGSSLPMSRAARQALLLDLFKLGALQVDEFLEKLEMGGVQKLFDNIRVDIRQAQRENLKMAGITPEIMQQFMQAQQLQLQTDPSRFMDPETGEPRGMTSPQGEPRPPLIVPVNNWDNDALHIETHNKYRKGQQFEQVDQTVKDLFDLHVMMHMEQLAMRNMTTITTGFDPEKMLAAGGQLMSPGPEPGPESEGEMASE